MNKNVRKVAFVLLLFFIAGTVAVFAISDEEYNSWFGKGYNAGYNYASSRDGERVKYAPSSGSTPVVNALRAAGLKNDRSQETDAFCQGFTAGFNARKSER